MASEILKARNSLKAFSIDDSKGLLGVLYVQLRKSLRIQLRVEENLREAAKYKPKAN